MHFKTAESREAASTVAATRAHLDVIRLKNQPERSKKVPSHMCKPTLITPAYTL